jgi:hypothetical protein
LQYALPLQFADGHFAGTSLHRNLIANTLTIIVNIKGKPNSSKLNAIIPKAANCKIIPIIRCT